MSMVMSDEDDLILEDGFMDSRGTAAWYQVKYWPRRKQVIAILCMSLIILVAILGPVIVLSGHHKREHTSTGGLSVPNGAVAADNAICSEIGKNILTAGGHAVDATVATALCQGVLNPFASGIGGGGIMIIYINNGNSSNEDLDIEIIDMRETAPAASTHDMYYDNPAKSATGPLAGGVPGELKGLYTAWQKYGKLPWSNLVIPAAKLAQNFTVQPMLAEFLLKFSTYILADPSLSAVYAPKGEMLKTGERCMNEKLATTLTQIAAAGVDIFYNGAIGRMFAQDIQDAGGILTFEDLQNYSVIFREPVSTYYMGYKMVFPPSPYGGLVMAMALNILERYNIGSLGYNVESLHWIVESLKFGFSDRLAMGDPDFVSEQQFVQQQMLDKDHASVLRQRLNKSRTYPPAHYIDLTNEVHNLTDHGTTHISVVDVQRNAVSFTSTVNLEFGARWVSKSTGILLNDEMNDFAVSNTTTNDWGLPPSQANMIAPGKRPVSSMSPSMVFKDNKLFMVAGANGGPMIITSTLQMYLNVLSLGKGLYDAVESPRLYVQFAPPVVFYEPKFPKNLVAGLQEKGNKMVARDYRTAVQAIQVQEDDTLLAVSDSRKEGEPAGY